MSKSYKRNQFRKPKNFEKRKDKWIPHKQKPQKHLPPEIDPPIDVDEYSL